MSSPSISYLGIHRQRAILPMIDTPACALQIICTGPWCVDWGDGVIETYTGENARHIYLSSYTGNVSIWARNGALTLIKEVHLYDNGVPETTKSNYVITPEFFRQFPKVEKIGWNSTGLKCHCNGDFAENLQTSVKEISIGRSALPYTNAVFNIDNLPLESQLMSLTSSYVPGAPCVIKGNIANFKEGFKRLDLNTNPNKLNGNVENLPQSLIHFNVNGSNEISGDIGEVNLPNLTSFTINGKNEISGDIGKLTNSKSKNAIWNITGQNKIYGNIEDISTHITNLLIEGENTLSGNIGLLNNPNLRSLTIAGKNLIRGSIDTINLSSSGTNFQILGFNSITGNIKYLPLFSKVVISGNNQLYGDIKDIPITYKDLSITGNNQIGGNIASIPEGVVLFSILGQNKIEGNINALTNTKNLTSFTLGGVNTVTGSISGITSQKLNYLSMSGYNTLSGDFSDFGKTKLTYIALAGNASINTYSTFNWNGMSISELYFRSSGHTLTSEQVDQLLIDMAGSNITWIGRKILYLDGINIKTRTLNSNSAFENLKQKGVAILPNKII